MFHKFKTSLQHTKNPTACLVCFSLTQVRQCVTHWQQQQNKKRETNTSTFVSEHHFSNLSKPNFTYSPLINEQLSRPVTRLLNSWTLMSEKAWENIVWIRTGGTKLSLSVLSSASKASVIPCQCLARSDIRYQFIPLIPDWCLERERERFFHVSSQHIHTKARCKVKEALLMMVNAATGFPDWIQHFLWHSWSGHPHPHVEDQNGIPPVLESLLVW